ncbi:MAG: B12-binding domain-containing radical SAM protein [Roseburia sp.]|nr:B12-binding domain-containing radical SAM protein [Roseburia sp.]
MDRTFGTFLLVAVNAKYIHSNPAIYSLRAYAGEAFRPYISLAEYTINNRMQDILSDIYKRKPDVIGFSCYIWNWDMIRRLLRELPKVLPETRIWLGGPEVSFHGDALLREFPQVRGIMLGEGEATFKELMSYYVYGDRQLEEIAGLCLPEGVTPCREPIDMNELPFLYTDLLPFENRIIYYETSRGCPYHCSYCLSSIEKKLRFRDREVVKKELQFFLEHRVKQVKFVDRTFNCDHTHAMAIWEYIKEHDNGVTNFHFEISADILREDEIALLNQLRPGQVQLEIGVQSTNSQTIEAIERRMDVEKLERIVAAVSRGKNIHQHLDLIAGLPYEDYESFRQSFDRVYAMRPQQLQLGFLKVLKGSPMEEKTVQYGIRYLDNPPYELLCNKWLSFGEVLRLKRIEEVLELYYNSNQFRSTLLFLEKAFEGPFALYEALADFYEEEGYFINSPARSYRYQVMLAFACRYDGSHEALYRELLTYDMYLRENLKSRPDFAVQPGRREREFIRSFYREEARSRRYLPEYRAYDGKQLSKMTHMEHFAYPVWDGEKLLQLRGEPAKELVGGYVLFDYEKRNPLTCEAKGLIIGNDKIICEY